MVLSTLLDNPIPPVVVDDARRDADATKAHG
jgi:hypothetical protein